MPPAGKLATKPAYEDPYMQYTDPAYVPPPEGQATSQTDASTGGGNYAPPPAPAEQPYSYGEPTSYADPHQQQYGDPAALYQPSGPQPIPGGVDYGAPQGGMLVGADAVPAQGGMLVGADAVPTPIPSGSTPEGVNLAQGPQTQSQPAIAPTGQSQDPSVPQNGYKPGQEYLGGSNLWPDPGALRDIAPHERNQAGLENIQRQPTLNTRKNNYDQLEQQRTGISNLYQDASGVDPSQGGISNPFAGDPNTPSGSAMYGAGARDDYLTGYQTPTGGAQPYFPAAENPRLLPNEIPDYGRDPLYQAGADLGRGLGDFITGFGGFAGDVVGDLASSYDPRSYTADTPLTTTSVMDAVDRFRQDVPGALGAAGQDLLADLSNPEGVTTNAILGLVGPGGGGRGPNGRAPRPLTKTLGGPEGGPRPTIPKNGVTSRPGEISPSGSTRAINGPKGVPSPEVTPVEIPAKPVRDPLSKSTNLTTMAPRPRTQVGVKQQVANVPPSGTTPASRTVPGTTPAVSTAAPSRQTTGSPFFGQANSTVVQGGRPSLGAAGRTTTRTTHPGSSRFNASPPPAPVAPTTGGRFTRPSGKQALAGAALIGAAGAVGKNRFEASQAPLVAPDPDAAAEEAPVTRTPSFLDRADRFGSLERTRKAMAPLIESGDVDPRTNSFTDQFRKDNPDYVDADGNWTDAAATDGHVSPEKVGRPAQPIDLRFVQRTGDASNDVREATEADVAGDTPIATDANSGGGSNSGGNSGWVDYGSSRRSYDGGGGGYGGGGGGYSGGFDIDAARSVLGPDFMKDFMADFAFRDMFGADFPFGDTGSPRGSRSRTRGMKSKRGKRTKMSRSRKKGTTRTYEDGSKLKSDGTAIPAGDSPDDFIPGTTRKKKIKTA
jgi:uncharacterized membrane protein YgcG